MVANSQRPISSFGVNWLRAWIRDALVTSIRDWLRPGTIVAIDPEASTTVVSRALWTVIVHMPSVSCSISSEGAAPGDVAYGWGDLPPAEATSVSSAVPSTVRKPCSCSVRWEASSDSSVMKRSAARLSSVVCSSSLTRVNG